MDTIEALYLDVAAIDILRRWTRPLCLRRFAGTLVLLAWNTVCPAAASARGASGRALKDTSENALSDGGGDPELWASSLHVPTKGQLLHAAIG